MRDYRAGSLPARFFSASGAPERAETRYAASTCSSPTNGGSSSSSNGTTSRTRKRWPAP